MTSGLFRPSAALRWSGLALALVIASACVPLTSTSPDSVAFPAAPPPQPVIPPAEVRLISAIEAQGCELTSDNVASVLLAANLTQAELAEITPGLADAGRVQVAGSGALRVVTDQCPAI